MADDRKDPTRTTTIRNQWSKDFEKRYNQIIKEVKQEIIDNDLFGVNEVNVVKKSKKEKIAIFMALLSQKIDKYIFDGGVVPPDMPIPDILWIDRYIKQAYDKGVVRALTELEKTDNLGPLYQYKPDPKLLLLTVLGNQNHQEKIKKLRDELYKDMRKIKRNLLTEVRKNLGKKWESKNGIFNTVADRIKKIGITRSTILARVAVVRSHHGANVEVYRNANLQNVEVMAEFRTAGDDRVCEQCKSLEGKVWTLAKIESLIPLHPNCRCVAIPIKNN